MRNLVILSLFLLLFTATSALAAGEIVAFDLQKVAAECDALKAAKTALDDKFGPQKESLEKERDELMALAAKYQAKAPTEAEQKDFSQRQRQYSDKAQAFMRLFQADEVRVRTDIDTLINAAAKSFAERKQYAMILDIAAVPYIMPSLDVTNDMLSETNAEWKKMQSKVPGAAQ